MLRLFFILVLLSTYATSSISQIAADFGASVTQGCNPVFVLFTDQSTTQGPAINSWSWDFGDGSQATSQTGSITHTYTTSGIFNVTLTVTNGANTTTVTKAAFIQVFEDPIVNFLFNPASGCQPHFVTFLDNSVSPDGTPMASWNWSLGNGSTSSLNSPNGWYTNSGTFDVSLEVTDANGCSSSKDSIGIINVLPKPNGSIGVTSPRKACDPPLLVNFNGGAAGGTGPYAFNWNFYAQGTSILQQPSVNYTNFGNASVWLEVTDANGCVDTTTATNYVQIGTLSVNFAFNNQTHCIGDTVFFNNTSSGANGFTWTLPGGITSNATDTAFVAFGGGQYPIKLVGTNSQGCGDSVTYFVNVEAVNASISGSPVLA